MTDTRAKVLTGVLLVMILGAVYLAVHVGAAITPTGHEYSWNIVRLGGDMLMRGAPWPTAATPAAIVGVVLVLALFTALLAWRARQAANKRGAVSNEHLASKGEVRSFQEAARRPEARRLHPALPAKAFGLAVGVALGSRKWIHQGWEDTGVYVFGNRQGKTSAVVVRHMADAPGALVLTSTKPDGVREAIALRGHLGSVYLFDPNGIHRDIDAGPDFVFNPLDTVNSYQAAQELAGIFEASTRTGDDRGGDAQFDSSGRNLLACAFLAAAHAGLPLATVWQWLSDQDGDEIANRLAATGLTGPAAVVSGILATHERTRTSTFATAHRMASALAYDELLAWTDTTGNENVRRLEPAAFVQSTDTLVLLAAQETGSAGAILTALVRAVFKAAEKEANRTGGRLTVPLVMELDECANIVRWPELPSLYSVAGSRGIIISSYFQNRSQALEAFGKNGWDTMWSNARIAVLGPGVKDDDFLKSLSNLAGEHDEITHGSSTSRDGQLSMSTNTRRQSNLTASQLAALPKWHMVLFPANGRPVMMKAKPWFEDRALKARVAK
jgi:type IV secretory pathway TraG/TraD family ATPase VirD4